MTLKELGQRKIWYEPAEDNETRFRMEDAEEFTYFVRKLTYEILPPERSVNHAEPVLTEFWRQLDEAYSVRGN